MCISFHSLRLLDILSFSFLNKKSLLIRGLQHARLVEWRHCFDCWLLPTLHLNPRKSFNTSPFCPFFCVFVDFCVNIVCWGCIRVSLYQTPLHSVHISFDAERRDSSFKWTSPNVCFLRHSNRTRTTYMHSVRNWVDFLLYASLHCQVVNYKFLIITIRQNDDVLEFE